MPHTVRKNMTHVASKLDESAVTQELGTVVIDQAGSYTVRTANGEYSAERAVSCLVEPVVGDEVVVACTARGHCFVLAVLTRSSTAKTRIVSDGDMEVRVRDGHFCVAADEGVQLATSGTVEVVANKVKVNAVDGSIVLQRLSYLGRYVQSEVEKIKLFAGTFDAVLDRFSQRVQRSYRRVEKYDHVQAEQMDYVAKQTMNLRANNAVLTAKEVVKVDGSQIHMG